MSSGNSILRPTSKRRDVQIHTVVTITTRQAGIDILGEKETELPQLAVEIPFNKIPMTEDQFRVAIRALGEKSLERARAYGLIRQ